MDHFSGFRTSLLEKQNKLARLEHQRAKAANDKKGKEQENVALKKEVKDLEVVVSKLGQEKSNKDHVVKTLNDEIEERDVTINKVSILVNLIPFTELSYAVDKGEKESC